MLKKEQFHTSVLKNIINKETTLSPSDAIKIITNTVSHTLLGSDSSEARSSQTRKNFMVEGIKGLISSAIRQHGISPLAILKNLIIHQSFSSKPPRGSK